MYEIIENSKVIFKGSADECAERLGCSKKSIYENCRRNFRVKYKYLIRKIGRKQYPCKKYDIYKDNKVIYKGLSMREICEMCEHTENWFYIRMKKHNGTWYGWTFKEVQA